MAPDGKGAAFIASFVSQVSPASSSPQELRFGLSSGGQVDLQEFCKDLVNSADPTVSDSLYGEEIRSEVDRWLSFASAAEADRDPASSATSLRTLDSYLLTRAVMLGSGTTIGLADVALFVSVHDNVAALPTKEHKSYPNLIRWIDYVQHKSDSSHAYEWISVEETEFDPPVSSAEPDLKKVVTSAEGTSVKDKGVSGTCMATSNQPQPIVKDTKVQQDKKGRSEALSTGKADNKDNAAKTLPKETKEPLPSQKDVPEFDILDIRVGIIVTVKKHPTAETLYVEEIDIGDGGLRQVVSGLAKYLSEDQMLNRRVLVLANVKPSKLRDVTSSGLVLCASNEDNSQCEPLSPPKETIIGERVIVAGFERKPEAVLNPRKKQWEKLYPDLHTNDTGVACYKGKPLTTSAGPCISSIMKGTIK